MYALFLRWVLSHKMRGKMLCLYCRFPVCCCKCNQPRLEAEHMETVQTGSIMTSKKATMTSKKFLLISVVVDPNVSNKLLIRLFIS